MPNLSYLELHPGLPTRSAHEQVGFDLGRDHARHGLELPAPYGQEPSVLREGLRAGRTLFGGRTLPAPPSVHRWLHLRLHAWLRGRSFELVQVTPHYLQQLEVTHCPITREALSQETFTAADRSIDRVRHDAGYAAGNLAVMSARANQAKGANGYADALRIALRIESSDLSSFAGLGAVEWRRIAVLCSYVMPLPHAEAAALPMCVLPPNRLRLFNPVQALQAFVSQQLLAAGWAQRMSRFEELLPGKPLQRDFKRFFMALLPRVLEGGRLERGQATRWAIEDAWSAPQVQERWAAFARGLTPALCETLLTRAETHRLSTRRVLASSDAGAVDGWQLATRGYVPHGPARSQGDELFEAPAQQQLAW